MRRRWIFGLAVIFLFLFLQDRIPLWSADEGRFGEISREMWETKDFIVPHFNGIEHFEKPVLAYWCGALSIGLLGPTSIAVRFPSVLFALLGILLTFRFTRRLFDEATAIRAVMVLATSMGYVLVGRYGMIDMVLTFFLSASIFCLAMAVLESRPRYYLMAYIFMGLSFITKGLIGVVLPLLILFCFLLGSRRLSEVRRMRLGWGVLIILALFVPWGIAISMREPEFSYVFITEQHLERFATQSFGRTRPFWFFVPILFSLALPWSLFLPSAVVRALKTADDKRADALRFMICWAGVILLFFSIPRSKLPYYILPLCIPMAVLIASWLRDPDEKVFRRVLWTLGTVLLLALVGLNIYCSRFAKDPRALLFGSLIPIGSVFLTAVMGLIAYLISKKRHRDVAQATAGFVFCLMLFVILGMRALSPYMSTANHAAFIQHHWKEGDRVAVYASPDRFSDLPFHLKHRVMIVGSDFGTLKEEVQESDTEHDVRGWFMSASEFVREFESPKGRIFCLMDTKNLPDLESQGLRRYRRVFEDGGKLLISNES